MLNTHVEATFQIPDVTKVLAVPDLLKLYMQPAVVAIAEKIESDLLNLYPSFTSNTPVGTGGNDRSPKRRWIRRKRLCFRRWFQPAPRSTWW